VPGFANPVYGRGRGFGRGLGRGRGWGRGWGPGPGRGRGWAYGWGYPGPWAPVTAGPAPGAWAPASAHPAAYFAPWAYPTATEAPSEVEYLRRQADLLKDELGSIEARLEELEAAADDNEQQS